MTPNTSDSLGRRARNTKASIATKAAGLLREKGLGITRDQIAVSAGVSHSLVVNYYPTREEFVRTVYAEALNTLLLSVEKTLSKLVSTKDADACSVLVKNFVEAVCNAFACRPVLAMTLLPFMPDPWQPKSGKVAEFDAPTFDDLTSDFSILLKKYWELTERIYTAQQVHEEAKIFMLAMLSGAANKLTAPAISEPVLRALL
ncbi:TetR/AcrR family transcriptional regulator [Streptomyces caniscabiei]|uniref:TetR/AcrR family transcriptional regulator n=1 Tax=Streptomyces caniscabiei TaxID=2746961 RepID=UPI0029AAE1BB|nr:TetR/AcrR family transcriptional regulator [Streptomyces caniscabiei]MDX2775772.1 TetR/AcrR family transcriptional regulator [Streptomyces caniscabiei]